MDTPKKTRKVKVTEAQFLQIARSPQVEQVGMAWENTSFTPWKNRAQGKYSHPILASI
ncbi:hypothetical protein [Methylomagnum sp.]